MPRRAGRWLFASRRTGRITIAQLPNVPLAIFLVARVGNVVRESTLLQVIATVALAWWAIDEIVRGVNPWRRILGAVVLAGQLVALR